jgi:predicted ABC-type ATPase
VTGTAKEFMENEPPPPHYIKSREALHEKIISSILNSVKSSSQPVAVLSGGGSGSGKSSVLNSMRDKIKDLAHIDADEIKKSIPEYEKMTKAGDESAAGYVHDESSDLTAKAISDAVDQKKPFLYDSTMANGPKFEKLVKRLKDAGYKVHIVFADLPKDEAIKRAEERAKLTGRKVPMDAINKSHENAPKTLSSIHDMAESVSVYSTAGKNPEMKYHTVNGQPAAKFKDESYVNEMNRRGHMLKSEDGGKEKDDLIERLHEAIKSTEGADKGDDIPSAVDHGVDIDQYPVSK